MSRSVKKGPYVHPKLMKKVEAVQTVRGQDGDQDLVAGVDDHAGDGGTDNRSPRRTAARAGVHY